MFPYPSIYICKDKNALSQIHEYNNNINKLRVRGIRTRDLQRTVPDSLPTELSRSKRLTDQSRPIVS